MAHIDNTLIRAEQSVLGGLMLDSSKLAVVEHYIDANDFYDKQHRDLFLWIKQVIDKGFDADPVSLADRIGGNGELLAFVGTLAKDTPSAANIEAYCKIVQDYSEKRKLKKQLTDALKKLDTPKCSPSSVVEFLDHGIEKTRNRLLSGSRLNISDSILNFEQLMQADIPERKKILSWLPQGGLAMVTALRGLGKTNFAISLADCCVNGKQFMRWDIENPTGVLFVDGEMSLHEIRERMTGFTNGSSKNRFSVLSHETFFNQSSRDLMLINRDIQQAILGELDKTNDYGVLIFDNLSSLTHIREDKADDWREYFLPFLIHCRRRGVAVVLVHHASKSGEQRGTSAREDHLDTSIKLIRPNDHENDGCYFKVEFPKSRGCYGDTIKPFMAKLIKTGAGGLDWDIQTIAESTQDRLVELIIDAGKEGIAVMDAAKELGVAHSLVSSLKRKLIDEKIIHDRPGRKKPMILSMVWLKKHRPTVHEDLYG